MQTYEFTFRDKDGKVIEQFEQGAVNLRVALDYATMRLCKLPAGHGLVAHSMSVENVTERNEEREVASESLTQRAQHLLALGWAEAEVLEVLTLDLLADDSYADISATELSDIVADHVRAASAASGIRVVKGEELA